MHLKLPWSFEPGIVASLVIATLLYLAGLGRLAGHKRRRVFGAGRYAAFAAGIVALVAGLLSPLDAIADRSFAGHMLQHLMLMLVAPPLLVASRPALAWLWAFPLPARRVLGRFWTGSGLQRGFRRLMQPLPVWLLCSLVLVFWHLPGPYDAALAHEGIHTLEHFCLFASSLMFWSLVIEPYGRHHTDYGFCLLMVAAFSVEMAMLGALLTFASHPLYSGYAGVPTLWGWTRLEDQQVAGLLMWIPTSVVHIGTLASLFLAWLRAAERRATAMTTRFATPAT